MSSETLEALRGVLVAQSDGMRVTRSSAAGYELHTAKPVEFEGRKVDSVFFAAVREGKNDTALHFMPIYTHPTRFEDLPAQLRKRMTGKSCFHIKTADPELLKAVEAMLKRGRQIYLGDSA